LAASRSSTENPLNAFVVPSMIASYPQPVSGSSYYLSLPSFRPGPTGKVIAPRSMEAPEWLTSGFDVWVQHGRLTDTDPGSMPDLVIETEPHLLVSARKGRLDLGTAARKGRLRVKGERASFERFLRVFGLEHRLPC
jgi:hypothetical protein